MGRTLLGPRVGLNAHEQGGEEQVGLFLLKGFWKIKTRIYHILLTEKDKNAFKPLQTKQQCNLSDFESLEGN